MCPFNLLLCFKSDLINAQSNAFEWSSLMYELEDAGGHLEETINVFDEHVMIVRSISPDKLVAVIFPKNLKELSNKINEVNSFADSEFTLNGLRKVSSTVTEFQKDQKNYYGKLEPEKFILVAEQYLDPS